MVLNPLQSFLVPHLQHLVSVLLRIILRVNLLKTNLHHPLRPQDHLFLHPVSNKVEDKLHPLHPLAQE